MSFYQSVRAAVLGFALVASGASIAQQGPADRTGTGGGPDSTVTAPYTTSTGQTKPPGVEEGPETQAERRELGRIKHEDDRIEKGICDGC